MKFAISALTVAAVSAAATTQIEEAKCKYINKQYTLYVSPQTLKCCETGKMGSMPANFNASECAKNLSEFRERFIELAKQQKGCKIMAKNDALCDSENQEYLDKQLTYLRCPRTASGCVKKAPAKKKSGADFSSLSFLDNEKALSEAEAVRQKFLQESMKLAAERTIKVKGYFNARDQAETLRKAHVAFKAAFGKAGSLAKAKHNLHLAAMKKALKAASSNKSTADIFDLAVAKADAAHKRLAASTKAYEAAAIAQKLAEAKLKAADSDVKKAQPVMAKDKKDHDARVKDRESAAKALEASKDLTKKANGAAAAAKAAWEKAELARVNASKNAATSLGNYTAAIDRQAAARAAAVKAHKAVQHHAKTGYMYMAQE